MQQDDAQGHIGTHTDTEDDAQSLTLTQPRWLLMHNIIANGTCLRGEVVLTSDQP